MTAISPVDNRSHHHASLIGPLLPQHRLVLGIQDQLIPMPFGGTKTCISPLPPVGDVEKSSDCNAICGYFDLDIRIELV